MNGNSKLFLTSIKLKGRTVLCLSYIVCCLILFLCSFSLQIKAFFVGFCMSETANLFLSLLQANQKCGTIFECVCPCLNNIMLECWPRLTINHLWMHEQLDLNDWYVQLLHKKLCQNVFPICTTTQNMVQHGKALMDSIVNGLISLVLVLTILSFLCNVSAATTFTDSFQHHISNGKASQPKIKLNWFQRLLISKHLMVEYTLNTYSNINCIFIAN